MTKPENLMEKRIGIVWAGSPSYPFDQNRTMSWETIEPLIAAHKDRFQFFSLRVGNVPVIDNPDVIELGASLTDYAVTAAIVMNLDLVISVDNSIVHLAGALAKRVWTMLFYTPDWRWQFDSDNNGLKSTSWYPNTSLFWQKRPGVGRM